ncbi:MAG: PHP domain-containing protein [Clostridiales bacterium]|nr:PHP domain-containing protein [Clostridiales bacterium]
MFDLHTHSIFSDGNLPPEKLIEEAKEKGLTLLALTDHDTADGVSEAAEAAERFGVPFLAGIEIEAQYSDELHILGLGIDPDSPAMRELAAKQGARRADRNERVLKRLAADGMDVRRHLYSSPGSVTKVDIADALTKEGYASSIGDAFSRLLSRGGLYYEPMDHPTYAEAISAIRASGGVAVLAHPMKMRCDHRELIEKLKACGLWGIEAYYSSATDEQTEYFLSLAKEFRLHPTCGSDYHGPGRHGGVTMGCAYRPEYDLRMTELLLKSMFRISSGSPCGKPRAARAAKVKRGGVSESEFTLIADRLASELPEDFFKGLNGGVVIADRAKLHKASRPEQPLYVLGEYHYGGPEGRYITLYYGSFMKVHGFLRGEAFKEKVKKVLLHEFRHHLETMGGEHDLEYEDDVTLEGYLNSPDVGPGSPEEPEMR